MKTLLNMPYFIIEHIIKRTYVLKHDIIKIDD